MWRGLLGRKIGMTQFFTATGERVGVTVIEAGPCPILQIKSSQPHVRIVKRVKRDENGRKMKDKDGQFIIETKSEKTVCDGYDAYQIGFDAKREHRATRPEIGHAKAHANVPAPKFIREIRLRGPMGDLEAGKILTLDGWEDVKEVQVTGTSKGKGFQGVMKRHGFHGLRATHGVKTHHRIPGSSGSLTPARVVKGRKAPGHMGDEQVTVKGLRVAQIRADQHLILVEGAVPGANGGFVLIRPAQPYQP